MEIFQQEKRDWSSPGKRGTCSEMCPPGEISERRKFNQLHRLERNVFNEEDNSFMIKKYYRSQTEETRQNSYLRNRLGIARSMDRLREVMNLQEVPFETRASFIWDRYRAIWKDMSIQNWQDIFRVSVLEEMVRFLILADFKIALEESQSPDLTYQDAYDEELGIQLLLQCFVTLSELYQTLRDRQQPCPNELEFRIYHILLQMTPVEGRDMEHDEISILFRTFPMDLLSEDSTPMEHLQYLYDTMKSERWDQIIDIVWQMEFFEFALGRRILERFRELRFKKYFRRLRHHSTLTTHPPMALHEFCDRFFLDKEGARQFAAAHSMRMELDHQGYEYIIIHEGIRKPKARTIPKIGFGIIPWGFIHGQISISEFVCQHPCSSGNPYFDFAYKELVWPSYTRQLHEWSFLSQLYNISEYGAALLQSSFWQKYNRLECLMEIPVLQEYDEEGNLIPLPYPLPFFRTVEPIRLIEQEQYDEEIQEIPVQETQEHNTDSRKNQLASQGSDSFFGGGTGAHQGFWVPTSPAVPTEPIAAAKVKNEEIQDPSFSLGIQSQKKSTETVDENHSAKLGLIYTNMTQLTKDEFEELVNQGRQKRRRFEMQTIGVQQDEDWPQPIQLLTPVTEIASHELPKNFEQLFTEYRARNVGKRSMNDESYSEELRRFKMKLSQRYCRILQLEESIPEGWRIRPKRRKQLLRVDHPWKDPELVPKTFPPQLTPDHLLSSLETHPLVQKPFISEELAGIITELHPHQGDVFCSFLLLRHGPLVDASFVQKWLSCRFFGDVDCTHISESVRCHKHRTEYLHYSIQELGLENASEQKPGEILKASALFLMIEDEQKMQESFLLLNRIASAFEGGDLVPPIVILDGRQLQQGLIHEDSILPIEAPVESEIYESLRNYLDCSMVDVFVISLSHHLGAITRSIFRDLCDKWRPDLGPKFQPKDELMVKKESEMDHHDPVDHAIQSIAQSLLLKENISPRGMDTDNDNEIDVEKITRDWEQEWKRVKNLGQIMNIQTVEELFNFEHRRQIYIKTANSGLLNPSSRKLL